MDFNITFLLYPLTRDIELCMRVSEMKQFLLHESWEAEFTRITLPDIADAYLYPS